MMCEDGKSCDGSKKVSIELRVDTAATIMASITALLSIGKKHEMPSDIGVDIALAGAEFSAAVTGDKELIEPLGALRALVERMNAKKTAAKPEGATTH